MLHTLAPMGMLPGSGPHSRLTQGRLQPRTGPAGRQAAGQGGAAGCARLTVATAHSRRLTATRAAVSSGAPSAPAFLRSTAASGPTMLARCGSSSCGCSWYLISCRAHAAAAVRRRSRLVVDARLAVSVWPRCLTGVGYSVEVEATHYLVEAAVHSSGVPAARGAHAVHDCGQLPGLLHIRAAAYAVKIVLRRRLHRARAALRWGQPRCLYFKIASVCLPERYAASAGTLYNRMVSLQS